jgi:hypothetical protein
MSGKKIAIIFFTTFGIGALLLASVWRVQGQWGFWVGLLGMVLMVVALKWAGNAVEEWENEKRRAKKQEEDLYKTPGVSQSWDSSRQSWQIEGEPEMPAVFIPQTNPALRRKLLWVFGILSAFGFSLVFAKNLLPAFFDDNTPRMAAGLALGVWSAFMFAAVKEKNDSAQPTHDFTYMWGSNRVFRRNNILFGILMLVVVLLGTMLTPPPPNAAPYIIGTFVSLTAVLVFNIIYLNFALTKGIPDNWTGGEKRLENITNVGIILLMVAGYPILSLLLPSLIEELYFALTFAAAGLLFGYFVHDFIKTRIPGFFTDDEHKSAILVKIYVGSLVLILCAAAFINRKTADYATETRKYHVNDKSKTYKGEHYLWLDIDGKNKRFEPKLPEWEQAQIGDSLPVLVGKGRLGFEVILQFGIPPADSSLNK